MSFDYYVAVHKEDWPTALAVQAALNSIAAPIELKQQPHEPFLLSHRDAAVWADDNEA